MECLKKERFQKPAFDQVPPLYQLENDHEPSCTLLRNMDLYDHYIRMHRKLCIGLQLQNLNHPTL